MLTRALVSLGMHKWERMGKSILNLWLQRTTMSRLTKITFSKPRGTWIKTMKATLLFICVNIKTHKHTQTHPHTMPSG